MNLQASILYSEQKFWFFWPAWCKFSNSVCLVLWWKLSLLWDILKKTSYWGELNETRIFKVSSNLPYWDWKRKPFPLLCNTFLCFSREGHIHRSSILVCLSKGVTVDFCCKNISANLFCPCCRKMFSFLLAFLLKTQNLAIWKDSQPSQSAWIPHKWK